MALPSEVNALLLGSGTEYQIARSLRFRAAGSAYLTRTPTTGGSQTTCTWSGWVKRTPGVQTTCFSATNGAGGDNTSVSWFLIGADNTISIVNFVANVFQCNVSSASLFRDPSAWYHLVFQWNTTNATAALRARAWVNGVEVTLTGTQPAQNNTAWFNTTGLHAIGKDARNAQPVFTDGYMAEVNFIDGQALTPSSFGYTDPKIGVWMPKAYLGTYGTNGFYLRFTDNSGATATTIGRDFSGNGNNWTPLNISVTAGVNDDSMIDSPTNYADGGNGRGNYAVWNSLLLQDRMSITNGSLTSQNTASAARTTVATIGVNSGRWYWELTAFNAGALISAGVSALPTPLAGEYIGFNATSWAYASNAQRINNLTFTAYGATYTTNDVIGVALDMNAGTLEFFKNGVSQGQAFNNLSGTLFPAMSPNTPASSVGFHANFGQRPFVYTPPAGFRALNTQNLPTTNIQNGALAFDAALYTGTGAARSITGELFTPDLVWIKSRSATTDHAWYDAVRGPQLQLESNNNAAETNETTGLTAFNSGGFNIGSLAQINTNAASYVAWAWDAGSSTVTNTAGTLTAGVRANPAAGVSIVTWTHNGSTGTIGHGLGVAPSMIIAKTRNGANDWMVYAAPIGATAGLFLNLSNAQTTSSVIWNNTAPTSTVFSAGSTFSTNACVAYCFANVPGFSIIGSYIGNGSTDGPFVFCGFRPRWVMIKLASGVADWVMLDTAMNPFNVASLELYPNLNLAENAIAGPDLDFLSNGFKLRNTSAGQNTSGGTHIFAAFAENPFKIARAR